MKKIALLLTLVIAFCTLSIGVTASDFIPVSAEIIKMPDEELKIIVFVENVNNLVSLRGVLDYDTSRYTLTQARASTYKDSHGEEKENLNGMWVFGNLSDGTGSVGAFISVDGVTKSTKTAVCEFVLKAENGKANPEDIVLCVSELVTDDTNEKNDIYIKTIIPFGTPQVDMSGLFEYEKTGETISITEIKSQDAVIFVPEYIEGIGVRSLSAKNTSRNSFLVFNRNILKVCDGAFSNANMIIAPIESAPVAAVKKSGGTYLAYYENVKTHSGDMVLYTDEFLVTDCRNLFLSNVDFGVTPSHVTDKEYFGTGSVISLKNGNKSTDFQLCVKGDVNGDSVCDALDVLLGERFINGLCNLEDIQQKSTDMNEDSNINPQDYTQLVNLALGSSYKLYEGVRGDLNGDNAVDVLDIIAFDRMMKNNNLSQEEKDKIDFNNNAVTDSNDRYLLTEIILMFE